MKRILLLGATGKTGREVLNYALSKGYHVTALVRNPENIVVGSDRLSIIMGTPLNLKDVRAIDAFEAVISTLGHSNLDPSALMTNSIKNMVTAMKEKGIRRIVIQTGAGAGDSFKRMPLSIQKLILDTGLKNVYDDQNGQEQVVMKSGVDWTVVRPVTLNDGGESTIAIIQGGIGESSTISRKTVAKFLVDCLEKAEFFGKALVISEDQ
jgi:putative NADH-flavin reductase